MYLWIWHKLPGGLAGKLAGTLLMAAAVVVVMVLVVFPWLNPKLPFNKVTVQVPTSTQPAPSSTANAVPN